MFSKQNIIAGVAILALLLAGLGLVGGQSGLSLGGVTNYDEVDATAIKIGTSGNRVGQVLSSTCSLIGADVSQGATTTKAYDCAITGIVSGDTTLAQFASSTPFTNGTLGSIGSLGWVITSSKASTTAGFMTVLVANLTGQSAILSATNIASTTSYLSTHPVSTVPGL